MNNRTPKLRLATAVANPAAPWPVARLAVREVRSLCADDCDDVARALTLLLVDNCAVQPSIEVVSRFGGEPAPRRTGRGHGARTHFALASTLVQVGNQLHAVVQLIDAVTGLPILTRTFTGQVQTIGRVLAAIAWTIANDIETAFDRTRAEAPVHARVS